MTDIRAPQLDLALVQGRLKSWEASLTGGGRTGSTNDDARALAAEGVHEKTFALATMQDAGRGRLGRTWASPPGGLYLSAVLSPGAPSQDVASLSPVFGVAVLRAMRSLGLEQVALKWPNDVLLPGGKLCGMSLEMLHLSDESAVVVPGIGINVNRPDDAFERAAYMSDALGEVALEDVAVAVIDEVCSAYDLWCASGFSFDPFREEYNAALDTIGKDVTVRSSDGAVIASGIAECVDGEGRLIVGGLPVVAGEVTLRN